VGTAVLFNRIDGGFARNIVIEEGIGPIRCATESINSDRGRARFELPQLPEEAGQAASAGKIASALGLRAEEIGLEPYKPSRWSGGVPMTFVPVRGLDAIRRCRTNLVAWDTAFGQDDRGMACVFCCETIEPGSAFHTRVFAPRLGVPEDPVTGGGAAAFAGVYVYFERPADGHRGLFLEQGYEMGIARGYRRTRRR
jgi:trans-2,3-dihydro-3-hydroxyanthranilate isomerase